MSNINKLFFFHRGSRYIHFNSLSGDQYGVSMSGGLENHSKPGANIETVLKSNLQLDFLDKAIYLQIWPNMMVFTLKCQMQNCFIKFISDGNSFGSFCTLQPLPDHPGEISDDYVLVQFVLLFRLSLLSLLWWFNDKMRKLKEIGSEPKRVIRCPTDNRESHECGPGAWRHLLHRHEFVGSSTR